MRNNPFAPEVVRPPSFPPPSQPQSPPQPPIPFLPTKKTQTKEKQPCHRCIAASGYIGGFQGDWHDAPSGVNIDKKLALLREEGVVFDERTGVIVERGRVWADFRV